MIAIAVLFVLVSISIGFRTAIGNLIRGTGLNIATGWNNVWPVIRRTAITAIIIGGIGWILMIALMIGLGVYANSFWSALIISIILPPWFVLMLIPRKIMLPGSTVISKGRWTIPIVRIVRPLMSILITIALLNVVVGLWSPAIKGSFDRWTGNKKGEIANSLNKSSLKSEPEMGKFARVIEDSQIYNQAGQSVFFVQKGTTVLVKNLDGKKTDEGSEGKTKVMLPNRQGDFQQGNEGWIPTRKLDWNWQSQSKASSRETREEVKSCQMQTPPPPPPTPRWKPYASFNFCPNRWNEKDLGWQAVTTLEPGEYIVLASGQYGQRFVDGRGQNPHIRSVEPDGLPIGLKGVPSRESRPLALIGRTVDNGIFKVGNKAIVRIFEKTELWLSVNVPQDSSDFGAPSTNFSGNKGSLQVEIKRKEVS